MKVSTMLAIFMPIPVFTLAIVAAVINDPETTTALVVAQWCLIAIQIGALLVSLFGDR